MNGFVMVRTTRGRPVSPREWMLFTVVGTIIRFFVSRWFGLPEEVETVYIYTFISVPIAYLFMNSCRLKHLQFSLVQTQIHS
jgi:hypothetical protein